MVLSVYYHEHKCRQNLYKNIIIKEIDIVDALFFWRASSYSEAVTLLTAVCATFIYAFLEFLLIYPINQEELS